MGKNALWKEIENAKWSARIDILCNRLNIPLLTSRGDLRKAHRNFPEIHQKLKNCYNDNMTRVLVQGTVVAIYARMCVDSSLRNKLAAEKSFYTQISRLLDSSVCRTVALQCLVTLTFYGDREFCYRIAGHIPEVLRLAQGNMDDPSVINACATIICRPVTMILCPGKDSNQVNPEALESAGPLLPIFTFFIALLRDTNTTYDTYKHILHCLFDSAKNARETFLSYQPSIAVMVAAFRSTSIDIRVCALNGLRSLHAQAPEQDDPDPNVQAIIQNVQRIKQARTMLSDEAFHALQAYGMSRSDVTLIDECFNGYYEAMLQFASNHDFYSLGMKLFELIGKTEISLSESFFVGPDGKPIDMGMPFTHWIDALPQCAKAVREKSGLASRDHIANVLDLKFFLLRQKYKEARELATSALEASPKTAYYYYVLALASNDIEEKLRWAKKGLRIQGPKVEPYVRYGLLCISAVNASNLGFTYLNRRQKCQKEFEGVYALLKLALDDFKVFIAEAPPDKRLMTTVIRWCVLLTISLKGPDLSVDLREIQPLLRQLKIAEEIESLITGKATGNCQLSLTLRDIVKSYNSAAGEWGHLIAHFDAQAEQPITSKESVSTRSPEDELADWLNSTRTEDDEDRHRCDHHKHAHPSRPVFGSEVLMYVCAHCGNFSVALKKCTRCLLAKYCDASCQKLHWQEHKKICKPPGIA